ncbi:MAG: hypothetical protein JXM68_07645 [Sedimentisphaerales bacterium]|nr:hypothetical protein [Sedimentisphaerales bacterium]
MRKMFLFLAVIALTVVPALAGPTNTFNDIEYVNGWWQVSGVKIAGTSVTPTLQVRVTGADATLETELGNWNGGYDLHNWQVPVYTVNADETFKVDVKWSGGSWVYFYSKDLVVWEGDASDNDNAIVNQDFLWSSGNRSWSSSLAAGEYYSCLFQVNNTSSHNKIALPFIIQAAPESVVAVPAPAAVLLAGFGTTMIGWMRRRVL